MGTTQGPRYERQTILPGFGAAGQQKLQASRVLVVGAGGLGCPVLQYLVGAGVGAVGIVDHDIVSLTNLHRQILYSTDDVGLSKATRAAEILAGLNPDIDINSYPELLTPQNAAGILSTYDIVVDGTDNFATRYLVNDCCVLLGKPLVYGAISQYEGQLAVFNHQYEGEKRSTNYRDLFPDPPLEGSVPNCAQAGVIGVLPGIIGTMMANEVLKIILGNGRPAINRLITYHSLYNQIYEFEISPNADAKTLLPDSLDSFINTDYNILCGGEAVTELDVPALSAKLSEEDVLIIDVREIDEQPQLHGLSHLRIPMSMLRNKLEEFEKPVLLFCCQTGLRSRSAARIAAEYFGASKKIYSLREGIATWNNQNKQQ